MAYAALPQKSLSDAASDRASALIARAEIRKERVLDDSSVNCWNLKNIDNEQFDKGNVTEYVSKYEWIGDDESFKILKYSSQFILDTVSKSDYEKFNIAIYGKKKES